MQKPTTITYGRHLIKVMKVGDMWQARAYLSGAKQRAGEAARAAGDSEDDAIANIKRELDNKGRKLVAARRLDERMGFHVPSRDEYVEAIRAASFTKQQSAMLKAHMKSGEAGLTAGEIARLGGYANYSAANIQYGKTGRRLSEAMGIELPRSNISGEELPTAVIAYWIPAEEIGQESGRWVMYPELREAVAAEE
jgi:hypothetical protein